MESTRKIKDLSKLLREDLILSSKNVDEERAGISYEMYGLDLLSEVELIEIFYLGLLSRLEKGVLIPEVYSSKSINYSVFTSDTISKWFLKEKVKYPNFYNHILKIEFCRSFLLNCM